MDFEILEVLDKDDRNEFLELGDAFTRVPSRDDFELRDQGELLSRLDRIQSPNERLKEFIKSNFYLALAPTHEAQFIRTMGVTSLAFGWLLGGVAKSRDLHDEFLRKHNAAVFEEKILAKRKYVDTFFYKIIGRGAKYGIGSFLLSTSAGVIGFGSIAYRNDLYLPDWLVGFGTVGAVTRCWLGVRGVVAGTCFGLAAGTFGFCFAKVFELASGKTVTQMRYLASINYAKEFEGKLSAQQRIRAANDKEVLAKFY